MSSPYSDTITKRCTLCLKDKLRTKENWDWEASNDGLKSRCHECVCLIRRNGMAKAYPKIEARRKAKRMAELDARPAEVKESERLFKERWWARALVGNARRSSRAYTKKGSTKRSIVDFDITEEFIAELFEKQNGRCYWYGIKLQLNDSKRNPRRPSIDRLDNDGGYTKGNVVLVSMMANMGRSEYPADQFRLFCNSLARSMSNKETVDAEI